MTQRGSSTILRGAEFGAKESLDDKAGRSVALKFSVAGARDGE